MSTRIRYVAALLVVCTIGVLAGCDTRYGSNLQRQSDPVVFTGADVPDLIGATPRHVVAFAHDGSAWHQIPVQVDERDLVNPGVIQNLPAANHPKVYGTSQPYEILVYTQPSAPSAGYTWWDTYTPVDSDPTLDADDEIAFLANDAGRPTDAPAPPGVDAASRTPVQVTDPIDGHTGTVYLFTSPTLTGGSAGTSGVDYTFHLNSGDYRDTYRMGPSVPAPNNANGPNPETTTVTTPFYTLGFSDRWTNDSLTIDHGSSGAELLDRSKYFAVTSSCSRTEYTFDMIIGYTGEFIANISGPVRGIRSAMGANSFTYTVLTDVFYPNRHDTRIDLRGHAGMRGFGVSDDLATGLSGMTYSDPLNTNVPIDGSPDSFTPITSTSSSPLPSSWQVVSGPAGTMITTRTLTTDLPDLDVTTTWKDDSTVKDCTGDTSTWGQAGLTLSSPGGAVPNSDPTLSADPYTIISTRTRYFSGPDFPLADAPALEARARTPLVVTAG